MTVFEARYAGVCLECGIPFPENTQIKYVPNTTGYRHAGECPDEEPPDLYPTCTTCWLVHPPGLCDR